MTCVYVIKIIICFLVGQKEIIVVEEKRDDHNIEMNESVTGNL